MLTRRAIAFITLHDDPKWMDLVFLPGETITCSLMMFKVKQDVVYSAEEFDVHRAAYRLLNLDDPVDWSVWISKLCFPSDLGLSSPYSI